MKLSTRLLLPLLVAVAGVMTAYTMWALRQRQETIVTEARRETRAYAVALGVGLEQAFRDPARRDVQTIIDRISREPKIYAILVYGADGGVLFVSDPLDAARAAPPALVGPVLRTGETVDLERNIGGQQVYSVLRPIVGGNGRVLGAFEVAQPLSTLQFEIRRVRARYLLNTLTLLAAVTVLMLWLVNRLVGRPMERLVAGARALGAGEMGHRVPVPAGGGEPTALAQEFNRMAERLEAARAGLLRETEERVSLERRLRESEKMAAVGKLAAGLAHEIAAPLHVIRGRAEMLLKREPEPAARERNLRIIGEQIGRITLIVQNLLDFARRREPRVERTDLGAVVDAVAELLEGEFEREGVRFSREGDAAAPVRGDADLLQQVFTNLLLNALQAMEGRPGERRVVVRLRAGADAATAEVEDTGPGISPEVQPHIFEPFYTTKTGGQGTGLGLPVALSIVEEHGGHVEVERASGGGALFRVTLPAAGEEGSDG